MKIQFLLPGLHLLGTAAFARAAVSPPDLTQLSRSELQRAESNGAKNAVDADLQRFTAALALSSGWQTFDATAAETSCFGANGGDESLGQGHRPRLEELHLKVDPTNEQASLTFRCQRGAESMTAHPVLTLGTSQVLPNLVTLARRFFLPAFLLNVPSKGALDELFHKRAPTFRYFLEISASPTAPTSSSSSTASARLHIVRGSGAKDANAPQDLQGFSLNLHEMAAAHDTKVAGRKAPKRGGNLASLVSVIGTADPQRTVERLLCQTVQVGNAPELLAGPAAKDFQHDFLLERGLPMSLDGAVKDQLRRGLGGLLKYPEFYSTEDTRTKAFATGDETLSSKIITHLGKVSQKITGSQSSCYDFVPHASPSAAGDSASRPVQGRKAGE